MLRTKRGNVTTEARKKKGFKKGPARGKFPIFDRKSAASALKLINNAKPPLSDTQKASIRRRAKKYLK
jgi:hypothetical protein